MNYAFMSFSCPQFGLDELLSEAEVAEIDATLLMVTHDMEIASQYDRIEELDTINRALSASQSH